MIDINNIISLALTSAINKAIEPLVERIDTLEKNEEALVRRITALENNPAIGVDTTLEKRVAVLEQSSSLDKMRLDDMAEKIAALETKLTEAHLFTQNTNVTIPIDEAKMVEALNSQEWFWHKVAGFVTNNGIDDELVRIKQRVEALESETQGENRYLNRDEVNELIAEAIDDHLGTYDHDEYDNHINDDDKHFDGDIEDAVRDALNGTSVTLSF